MSDLSSYCFLWKEPASAFLTNLRSSLRRDCKGKVEEVFCYSSTQDVGKCFPSIQAFLLNHCRTLGLLPSPRTTYYSHIDHILTLRVVMDSIGRKLGDGSILVSDIAYCHEQYSKCSSGWTEDVTLNDPVLSEYKMFLERSNAVNDWTLAALLGSTKADPFRKSLGENHLLVLGVPTTPEQILLLKLLVGDRRLRLVTMETPLDASLNQSCVERLDGRPIEISHSDVSWEDLKEHFSHEVSVPRSPSGGQRYVEDVFLAFFRLVVNIRDELALLRALMSPLVNLPQDAFLLLKRAAADKGISICQFSVSYVTRFQLGGRSYAPPADCALRSYLPQLSAFGQLLDKLQTITEEERSQVVAVKKLISYLTNQFLKATGRTINSESIQAAADSMKMVLEALARSEAMEPQQPAVSATDHSVCLLQKLVDHCCSWTPSSSLVSDLITPKSTTPMSGLSPFSFFRTPDEVEPDSVQSLSQRISCNERSETPVCTRKFRAGLPWGDAPSIIKEAENSIKDCRLLEGETENFSTSGPKSSTPVRKKRKQPNVKRSILGDIMNQQVVNASREWNTEMEHKKQKKMQTKETKLSDGLSENKSGKEEPNSSGALVQPPGKRKHLPGNQGVVRRKKQKNVLLGQTMIGNFFQRK